MKETKHILFIFRSLGTGGSQKVQAFVANACIKAGYKVSIIAMSQDKCSLDIDPKIDIYTVDYDKVSSYRGNFCKYLFGRLNYLRKFRKKCKEINPNLICVFLIDIVRLTTLALKGTSYPILGSERADPSQFSKDKIKQYQKALNNCVAIVYQLENVANYYDIGSQIIQEVIPNPSIVRNIDEPIGENNNDEPFIFGGGRLVRQKRFDVLIDAYNIVHDRYPHFRLKIYGDGEELLNLKKQVARMGLTKDVDFMGNVRNIFQDVNDKSIFVLTSDFEGIPNVITEALINQIPCVATDCSPGGARLLLNNGMCGEIVECGDFKQIAQAIMTYIENPHYARRKVEIGKEYIKEFNQDIIEEKWLNLFKRILDNDYK